MAFTVIVGSGLVARDRAAGAMPLYLSRPLTRVDYGLGKFCILAWFTGALTMAPCLLLWLFDVISAPEDGALLAMLPEVPRILLHGGVIVVTYSATMLAVSSLFRRPMFAGLVWFALIVFLPSLLSFANTQLHWTALTAISPNDSFQAIGMHLWGIDRMLEEQAPQLPAGILQTLKLFGETPVEWCWVSVFGWTVASAAVVSLVLRRQDVVTDAAR
jgi:hypothetical protein